MSKRKHSQMTQQKHSQMTLKELKDELRQRGAKLSGRKEELVARLDYYVKNNNFGNSVVNDVFTMNTPNAGSYKDINSDSKLPDVTEEGVQQYLSLFNQDLGKKAKSMYDSHFIQSIRYACDEKGVFVCGRVYAEMHKKCLYVVDIRLDEHGVVCEAQCECATGMGPDAHCKHAAILLYSLTKVKDGILTQHTCTQTLQTFHHVKKHTGSPMKMRSLSLRQNNPAHILFDPRDQTDQKSIGYYDMFRNVWINSSGFDLSIRHEFASADVRAIAHDHDYLEEMCEDIFLRLIGLVELSDEERHTLEIETQRQSKCRRWFDERSKRLHASNFGRICKATSRTDFVKLSRSLINQRDISSDAIRHGRKYEAHAVKSYEEVTGSHVTKSGIIVANHLAYLGCSPDGLVGSDGIIEAKCPYANDAKTKPISPDSVPYLEMKDGALRLSTSHPYYYQIMGTLYCTERKWCDLIVWTLVDQKVIHIDRDEKFILEMIETLKSFYGKYHKEEILNKFFYHSSI